jgi:hypothetical protein
LRKRLLVSRVRYVDAEERLSTNRLLGDIPGDASVSHQFENHPLFKFFSLFRHIFPFLFSQQAGFCQKPAHVFNTPAYRSSAGFQFGTRCRSSSAAALRTDGRSLLA